MRRCSRRAGAGTRPSRSPCRGARGGRRLAPQLQRMLADDLMAAVFPDAAACLENIPGDRQIPDHPLVNQTVRDCLQEAMDFDGLRAVLGRIHRGELRLVAVRHARAVGVRARHPEREAVRVPRRCAARGAAGARGADAPRRPSPSTCTSPACSTRGHRARARRSAARSARRRRAARRADDRRLPDRERHARRRAGVGRRPDRRRPRRLDACLRACPPTSRCWSRRSGCRSGARSTTISSCCRRSRSRARAPRATGPGQRRSPSWCAAG